MRIWYGKLQKKFQSDISNGLLARGKTLLTVDRAANRRLDAIFKGICATKIVHEVLVTLEPIKLEKTATPQNYENELRISNF